MDPEILIREANTLDAADLINFVNKLSEEKEIDIPLEPGEFNLSLEEEISILNNYHEAENSIFLVAEYKGQIIASLNISGGKRKALRHSAELGISVAAGWRGKGVGNALMEQAVRWAGENPVLKRIELQVYARNQKAIHLYEKHGFVLEGRRKGLFFQNGEYLDDLIMALYLWIE